MTRPRIFLLPSGEGPAAYLAVVADGKASVEWFDEAPRVGHGIIGLDTTDLIKWALEHGYPPAAPR